MPAVCRLALTSLVIILGGCAMGSSKFDCPGMPEGAVCKSPQEVYKATNNADHLYAEDIGNGTTSAAGKASADALAMLPKQLMEPITQPMPVLEPAQTIRVWIAPWIDRRGDLHFPSLLFSEVTSRRWSIGESVGRSARVLTPLGVDNGGDSNTRSSFDPSPTSGAADDDMNAAAKAISQIPMGAPKSGPVPAK